MPGAGNLVSGNGRIGISVFDTSSGNLIEGNDVGTNAAGTGALGGNPECGIVLISASNTVGGTSVGARNVISGNGGGCGMTTGAQPAQTGASGSNTIEGNYIGMNAAGTAALGNGTALSDVPAAVGIQSSNNQVGGTAVGAGNVISGNVGPGVWFDTSSATANVVQGNDIGTDATTTRAIGNSSDGVLLGLNRSSQQCLSKMTVPLASDGLGVLVWRLDGGRGCRRGGSPRGAGRSGDSRVRADQPGASECHALHHRVRGHL